MPINYFIYNYIEVVIREATIRVNSVFRQIRKRSKKQNCRIYLLQLYSNNYYNSLSNLSECKSELFVISLKYLPNCFNSMTELITLIVIVSMVKSNLLRRYYYHINV